MITAEAQEENADQKSIRRNTHFRVKEVKNVSIEEWDCPKPGSRRYMPRSVKENIKKNLQKVNGGPDSTKVGFDHY
ncbi:MAG TPA: hypothetical protein VD884_02625 [Ohtaekwangia sp.]|nr:hypothetical protein [Ohtaekwangia sp.]